MSNNFKLNVNQTYTYDISSEQIDHLDIINLNDDQFHILKDQKSYQVEIVAEDFLNKTYTLKINGSTYEVSINTALDQLIKEMGFEVGSSKQVNTIKAPMPGLILSINVQVGQEVQENESLLILEAMKMENNFTSPRAGIIKSIMVEQGQAVDKGQLLIEFE